MLKYLDQIHSPVARALTVQKVSRRAFLGTSSAFAVAVFTAPRAEAFPVWETGGSAMPNGLVDDPMVFVSIDTDGTVHLVAHRSEMGTGSRTTLPMIMADEMEADWDRVNIIQAEGDEPKYGNQNTDGSRSLRHHIQAARKIGGSVRMMLAGAAAEEWGVPVGEVVVSNHTVSHGGKSLGFGDLAENAMAMPVPAHKDIDYKSEDAFRYIGKGQVQITDLRDITTGAAVYGADVTLPGMKIAMVARPPVVGGKATSFDAEAAMAIPGVVAVHELPYSIMPAGFAPLGGVAVVADNTYAAIQGREALNITWEGGPHAGYTSKSYMAEMVAETRKMGTVMREQGDPDTAFANAAKVFTQTYTQDHMAHIPMEPPVALANFTGDAMEIWAPVQSPYQARQDAAKAVGLDEANVRVNVTLLGGGFGRKSKADYVTEAALLSQLVKAPVRVQWTREDDVHHSFYHTASAERIEAALDGSGKVVGWRHNSTAPSILSIFAPDSGHQFPIETGMGHVDVPFDIPNVRMDNGKAMAHTRIGWFRAVSNVPRAWAIGSFVGELAHELGKDQRAMWLELIGAPRTVDTVAEGYPETYWNYGEPANGFEIKTGKLINVLNIAADAIGYGKDLPEGEGIGLAVHRSFVSYVAVATRVKIIDGKVTVPEMHMAIDCGYAANPERISSQMEGASVMGMTIAQHSGITFADGAVEQSNFYDYDVTRSTNYPNNVKVHIVPHGFDEHSTGVGEPGVPPVAPSIANAVFEAQGKRLRHIPMGEMI
ncbi:MAG: molybdopterin-dependent oxidoreductase [Sulfitobacter sp.]|nr:molybdopterin-dependent oxidoreductase [Sulfitobacter sp.]